MQSSCMGSLMELAEQDPNILYLTADSGEGGLDLMFRRYFPDRAFEFGIAEENLVGAAAGLAASGKIPFVYTAAPFLAYRAYEFIRTDVCLQNLPVKLIGSGSGLSVGSLGPTHHTTEDIAVLRSLPNLTILSPATPRQAYACVKEAYRCPGPVYIRLAMNRETEYFDQDYQLPSGRAEVLRDGRDAAIISTGCILDTVMTAAAALETQGISVSVINVPTIKPFDAGAVRNAAQKCRILCTVEEHNIYGGLASIVADTLVDSGLSARLLRVGLHDAFSVGYGGAEQVRRENGLSAELLVRQIQEALS